MTRHPLTRHVPLAAALVGALLMSACTTSSPTSGPSSSAPASSAGTPATSGTATGGTAATPSTTTPSTTTPPNTTVVRVSIRGKNVTPAPGDVNIPLGSTLRLIVTSDHNDQLHAHGFDVEAALTAGRPTTLHLRATTPGTYEIETHHPPLTLMHVVVR